MQINIQKNSFYFIFHSGVLWKEMSCQYLEYTTQVSKQPQYHKMSTGSELTEKLMFKFS